MKNRLLGFVFGVVFVLGAIGIGGQYPSAGGGEKALSRDLLYEIAVKETIDLLERGEPGKALERLYEVRRDIKQKQ